MPLEVACHCTLCNIELHLLTDLTLTESSAFDQLLSVSSDLRQFPSVSGLLLHLRRPDAVMSSDELMRGLFAALPVNPAFIESLLVLVFLPMLHGTIRRVAKQQPGLLAEDITQQTLSVLLQVLRSGELRARQSHFAFAISRAVKRQVFEWANREGGQHGAANRSEGEFLDASMVEESSERYVLLGHFLDRCVTKGLISSSELDLLIQSKLQGNSSDEVCGSSRISSNALRQRLKRLLAKLRRLAK
jgi:DNA-directed RNA polymerase specialized sigma24 family protein